MAGDGREGWSSWDWGLSKGPMFGVEWRSGRNGYQFACCRHGWWLV